MVRAHERLNREGQKDNTEICAALDPSKITCYNAISIAKRIDQIKANDCSSSFESRIDKVAIDMPIESRIKTPKPIGIVCISRVPS